MATDREDVARRRLSRDRVVAAALAIVDRDGLKGLTMRALGRELDVDPMAVYHWVPRKDALLDLIVDAVFAEIPLDVEMPEGDWKVRFTFAASVVRDTLRRHPYALPVLAARPAMSVAAMRPAERVLGLLREAGFPADVAVYGVDVMSKMVFALVLAEVGLPSGAAQEVGEAEQTAMIRSLDPVEFPALAEAFTAFEFSMDREFELGMEWLTHGMERMRG